MSGRLETTRRFYVTHRGWLVAAATALGASIGLIVAGLFVFGVMAVIGAVAGVAVAVGAFLLPPWRTRVEERSSSTG